MKLCKGVVFATHYYRSMCESVCGPFLTTSAEEKVQFTLHRMCFDCKLPFSTLSLIQLRCFVRLDILLTSSVFERRHTLDEMRWPSREQACVCHHVSLNYIFFIYARRVRDHICFSSLITFRVRKISNSNFCFLIPAIGMCANMWSNYAIDLMCRERRRKC